MQKISKYAYCITVFLLSPCFHGTASRISQNQEVLLSRAFWFFPAISPGVFSHTSKNHILFRWYEMKESGREYPVWSLSEPCDRLFLHGSSVFVLFPLSFCLKKKAPKKSRHKGGLRRDSLRSYSAQSPPLCIPPMTAQPIATWRAIVRNARQALCLAFLIWRMHA